MKAIILVAGIGIKLRPHTHTQPKALVPVAGKPILAHIIDTLISGGIEELIFIVGYLGGKIESFVTSSYGRQKIKTQFIRQEPRKGTGHAIWSAKEYIKDEKEILIMLGDSILNLDLPKLLKSKNSVLGVKKVDTPTLFGIAEVDKDGLVKKLVEKPSIPKSNRALVGIYKIGEVSLLLEAADHIVANKIKTHGEYQLTDVLMYMISKGASMTLFEVDNWYDCGKKESLLEANAILLGHPSFQNTFQRKYPGSIIIPPVSIGKSCKINSSIVGPNVALGDNTIVSYSIVKNTIVGSFSELKSAVLENSIIGNDTSLKGLSQSLNIGDNTEIHFTN